MRVTCDVLLESSFPFDGVLNLPRWDDPLLHGAVREYRSNAPVKKVEHPVVDSL